MMLDFVTPETILILKISGKMFAHLFVELTILFFIVSYIVALLNQKLSNDRIKRLLGDRAGRGYFMAALLGSITPFCTCSTIPMLIGLLRARAGFGPTMTFLFASPLVNPIVIVLFAPIFGVWVTIWYVILALMVSIVAGVCLDLFGFERYVKSDMIEDKASSCASANSAPSCCGPAAVKEPSLWRKAWDESWSLFFSMMPYMVVAMVIGSLVHGFVPADFFADIAHADNPAAVPVAALIGIPLYVRVTTLLPLVSSFVAKGVSLGAVIALIIGSGGASLPEVIMLKRLFYWPLLLAFLLTVFGMAILGGYGFNLFLA